MAMDINITINTINPAKNVKRSYLFLIKKYLANCHELNIDTIINPLHKYGWSKNLPIRKFIFW